MTLISSVRFGFRGAQKKLRPYHQIYDIKKNSEIIIRAIMQNQFMLCEVCMSMIKSHVLQATQKIMKNERD